MIHLETGPFDTELPYIRGRAQLPCRTAMDIDDLLAEVAVDSTPQELRDLQELTRAWVAERTTPEILNWPEELMERVLERIRRQVCWSYCSIHIGATACIMAGLMA